MIRFCERCKSSGVKREATEISHAWYKWKTYLCFDHVWPEDFPAHPIILRGVFLRYPPNCKNEYKLKNAI